MVAQGVVVFIALLLGSGPTFACAELKKSGDRWRQAVAGVEFVDNEAWSFPCAGKQRGFVTSEVRLTAYRFERRLFEFILVDPGEELKNIPPKFNIGGAFLDRRKQFIRFGQNIVTMGTFLPVKGDFSLYVAAGWWQDFDSTQSDGYLKINGNILNDIFARSQSAIICLDDRSLSTSSVIGNTIAVLFYYNKGRYAYSNWSDRRKERLRECRNVFQTGPRIVERQQDQAELLSEPAFLTDPSIQCLANEDKNAGICARASTDTSAAAGKQRVVLAADDRPGEEISQRRRYYIIYFHSELPFYQIQSILLSEAFYEDARPEWAVNLAGGDRAGIFVRYGANYRQYGNLESDLPSLLSVRRRP
jgi:hypothetical protein